MSGLERVEDNALPIRHHDALFAHPGQTVGRVLRLSADDAIERNQDPVSTLAQGKSGRTNTDVRLQSTHDRVSVEIELTGRTLDCVKVNLLETIRSAGLQDRPKVFDRRPQPLRVMFRVDDLRTYFSGELDEDLYRPHGSLEGVLLHRVHESLLDIYNPQLHLVGHTILHEHLLSQFEFTEDWANPAATITRSHPRSKAIDLDMFFDPSSWTATLSNRGPGNREFRTVVLRLNKVLLLLSIAVVAAASGCSETGVVPEAAPVPFDPTRNLVERMIPGFDERLREHAETVETGHQLAAYIDHEASRSWNARLSGGIKYADLFQTIYQARGNRKLFADTQGTRPRGEIVTGVLNAAQRHALEPSSYHVARIASLDDELRRMAVENPTWTPVRLEPQEVESIIAWAREEGLNPSDPDTEPVIFDTLVRSTPETSPAPRVTEHVAQFKDAFNRTAKSTVELELRIADGALRYARDMKHFNLARQDWRDLRDAGGSKALIYDRLETTFYELADARIDEVESVFNELEPPHPQYRKLVDALENYRSIAASGGWGKVRSTGVEPGAKSPRVLDLRTRLWREGYLDLADVPHGDRPNSHAHSQDESLVGIDEVSAEKRDFKYVDERLSEAVRAYRETHQFRTEGKPSAGFWRSLNVPVEKRIEQIETTLQRWRESHYDGEPNYIFVNIPDFHAEVYEDHERQLRFRVVVGNRDRKCDQKTQEWVYPNATPVQMATLDHVIVNPSWWIPSRIQREEIEPKIKTNPDYLEENDYEWVTTRDGAQRMRQKPGDLNALGRVKFIFPNPHNTYMHDTPKQRYFEFPLRAFSHGCVRVKKPIELARYLLEKDELATTEELDEMLRSGRTRRFTVKDQIPVFFEYYVVKVDEQGRANFLADIYRLDKLRNSDDPDALKSCRYQRPRVEPADDEEAVPDIGGDEIGP